MDDKATAAKIVSNHLDNATKINELESAIVAALEAARREGAAGVMRPPTVAQPPSPNTLLSDIDDDHDSNWCD